MMGRRGEGGRGGEGWGESGSALAVLPWSWRLVVAAFLLERGIDILKVWPANGLEKRVKGGWGVVLDDVVAGIYACVLLHLACRWFPTWLGLVP